MLQDYKFLGAAVGLNRFFNKNLWDNKPILLTLKKPQKKLCL